MGERPPEDFSDPIAVWNDSQRTPGTPWGVSGAMWGRLWEYPGAFYLFGRVYRWDTVDGRLSLTKRR
jgi:hypothetical protein